MRLTLGQKRAVTVKQAARYRGHGRRSSRGRMLDEVQRLTDYAAWLLRNVGKVSLVKTAGSRLVKLVIGQVNKRGAARRLRHCDRRVEKRPAVPVGGLRQASSDQRGHHRVGSTL